MKQGFRGTALLGGVAACLALLSGAAAAAENAALKTEAVKAVDARAKLAQQMTDSIFSFGEIGFEESETSRYVTDILEKNGFKVTRGVAGLPTGWTATWGRGGPLIALGSDIDGVPQASQKPGVPYHDPIVPGAPGHGEGHNSGIPLVVVAALAAKEVMQREGIPGRLMIWPGVAEELLSGKAWFVRAGVFKDADAVLFAHVSSGFTTSWGEAAGTGMISAAYTFDGKAAHSGASPWFGRSALDAVELMNMGWNMRREHLRLQQRSHYVITNGGDQPNVVPPQASVWYYFREQSFDRILENFAIGNRIADAAAAMTDTKVTRRTLGAAAPRHFNKPLAEAAWANIETVGMPAWNADDRAFAKTVQHNLGAPEDGLKDKVDVLRPPPEENYIGGSDDIGDVSWTVPTITLNYPSNIPGIPAHHWGSAIAMATPIAHKGVVNGAKAMAMTVVDLMTKPALLAEAKAYFTDVQTKDQKYVPFLSAEDTPPILLNRKRMDEFRPELKKHYYNPDRYGTYLEQLGVRYPNTERRKAE